MSIPTKLQRLILTGMLALSGMVGSTAVVSAQDEPDWEPDYYKSMLTGYEVEISGNDYEINDVGYQEYADGENEQIYIESEYASLQVTFLDDSDTPEETIELWIEDTGADVATFEIVDNGVDDDVTWYFAEAEYNDMFFVYYIQVHEDVEGNVDMLESILTLDGNLVLELELAQNDISIDGDAFMDDVDLDELEDFLDGGSFRDGGGSNGEDRNTSDDDADERDDSGDRTTTDEDDFDEDTSSSSRDRERIPAGGDDDEEEDDGGN